MNTPELVIAVTDTVESAGDVFDTLGPTFKEMAEQRAHLATPADGQPQGSTMGVIAANAGTLVLGAVAQHEKLIPELKEVYKGAKAIWKAFKDPALPDSWDKKRKRPNRCDIPEPDPLPPGPTGGDPIPDPIPTPVPPVPTEPIDTGPGPEQEKE